jgi:hypothetical protein
MMMMMMIVEQSVECELAGEPKYLEKTCRSATWFTTNPTLPDPGLNPGRRDAKPATNRLSRYGVSQLLMYFIFFCLSVKYVKLL